MIQYLYFHNATQCARFSDGTWYGRGIHSDPLARQAGWFARLELQGTELTLELLGRGRIEAQPWQKKFRSVYSRYRLSLQKARIEADRCSCEDQGFFLEYSAIRPHRISLVLKKESIRFAGELQRPHAALGRWDQALWALRRFSASRSSSRR